MDNKLKEFVVNLINQNPIPLTSYYQYNSKITITVQLTDKGLVCGWQDKRMADRENNITMIFSELHFEVKTPPKTTSHRIDDFIDKTIPKRLSQETSALILPDNKIQKKPKDIRIINIKESAIELLEVMQEVIENAEMIYFLNSGLKDATERRKIK